MLSRHIANNRYMSYSLGKQILRNTSFVFSAQILVLLISIARALILPKIFPVESFGYWSVYWFYTSYVGIFCLGFNDGIYLKFGEYNYEELPHKLIRSAVRLFTWMLFSFTAICILPWTWHVFGTGQCIFQRHTVYL